MLRKLLKSKIHRATITRSDLNYEGSIAIDTDLLQAADIQPFEAVHVWNVTNGSRLQTYALPSVSGSGEICLNGAAARHAQAGDLVIVASFSWVNEAEAAQHQPKLIFVDEQNHQTREDDPGNHGSAAASLSSNSSSISSPQLATAAAEDQGSNSNTSPVGHSHQPTTKASASHRPAST